MVKRKRVYDDEYATRFLDSAIFQINKYQGFLRDVGENSNRVGDLFSSARYLSEAQEALDFARGYASPKLIEMVNEACSQVATLKANHKHILEMNFDFDPTRPMAA